MMTGQRDIIANIERLHHVMDQANCAAIVVRSGKNVTYLSGFAYPGTLARHLDFPDSPREILLVWPRQGEPVLITNHYAAQQFRQHGYSDRVSLAGHSVGPWWHQQEPYLVPTCHQELEAGMVLALEPHVGYWHLQDLIEITPDGPNLLSDRFNTDDMLVIG